MTLESLFCRSVWITLSCLGDPEFYQDIYRLTKKRIYKYMGWHIPRHIRYPYAPLAPYSDPALSSGIPVDLVYTWVDGNCETHKANVRHWAAKIGAVIDDQEYFERYIERNELKLSLRSAEKYLPWINRIYIITNGQVPDWLELSHPKLTFINHADIFPSADCLPTFNSNAIEFQLHRIPGLSEHFIYCCDDTFFGAPCLKEDFFVFDRSGNPQNSQMRLRFTAHILPPFYHTSIFRRNWSNLRYLLERDHPGRKVNRIMIHQAIPLRKSVIEHAITRYPDIYHMMSHSHFRADSDLPAIGFFCHVAYLNHHAIHSEISEQFYRSLEAMGQFLRHNTAKLLCFNEQHSTQDACDYLASIGFCPAPSSFEKKTSP
jgi:hypothetical protein